MNTKIPARKLGTLEVSAIGLGCMGMTFSYAPLGDVGVSRLAVYYKNALSENPAATESSIEFMILKIIAIIF